MCILSVRALFCCGYIISSCFVLLWVYHQFVLCFVVNILSVRALFSCGYVISSCFVLLWVYYQLVLCFDVGILSVRALFSCGYIISSCFVLLWVYYQLVLCFDVGILSVRALFSCGYIICSCFVFVVGILPDLNGLMRLIYPYFHDCFTVMTMPVIDAETKWPLFRKRNFQMHFLEWKCIKFDQHLSFS